MSEWIAFDLIGGCFAAPVTGIDISECPYMPPGMVTMEDGRGTVVANLKTGHVFRLPPLEFKVEMPTEFRREGDRIIGDMKLSWEFRK